MNRPVAGPRHLPSWIGVMVADGGIYLRLTEVSLDDSCRLLDVTARPLRGHVDEGMGTDVSCPDTKADMPAPINVLEHVLDRAERDVARRSWRTESRSLISGSQNLT